MAGIDFYGGGAPRALSLKAAGAVGDGVADDTQAYLQWLIQVAALDIPGYIDPGRYLLKLTDATGGGTGPGVIQPGMEIYGEGEASVLTRPAGSTFDRPFMNTTGAIPDDVYLHDFKIDYAGDINTSGSGYVVKLQPPNPADRARDVRVERVTITNTPLDAFALFIGGYDGVDVVDCTFDLCRRDAIHLSSCTQFRIDGNRVTRMGIDSGNDTDGAGTTATGDDMIALTGKEDREGPCTDGIVVGNTLYSPHQGRGRGIWMLGGQRVVIVGNTIRGGWRTGITIEGLEDQPMSDVAIVANAIQRSGEWNSTTGLWGDCIDLTSSDYGAATADANGPIRRILIANNIFKSPRRHGVRINNESTNSIQEGIEIRDNIMAVDRTLTHYDSTDPGCFVFCDLTPAGAGGTVLDLELHGNRSYDVYGAGVCLIGSGIKRTRVVDDRHFNAGQTAAKRASFEFEDLVGLTHESCVGADLLGGSWRTNYGATYTNITGRVRIIHNDFTDTQNANVTWGPGGAPAVYDKGGNFSAAALP